MSEQDEMDSWQAAQHADETAQQEVALDALKHARNLGLSENECMALAYMAGIANQFYQEIRK